MADVNSKLKDYLSKSSLRSSNSSSSVNTLVNTPESSSGYFQKFFKESKPDTSVDSDSNGWFTSAQNDPFLPSLVIF